MGCIALLLGDAQWPHFSELHLFSKSPEESFESAEVIPGASSAAGLLLLALGSAQLLSRHCLSQGQISTRHCHRAAHQLVPREALTPVLAPPSTDLIELFVYAIPLEYKV